MENYIAKLEEEKVIVVIVRVNILATRMTMMKVMIVLIRVV